GISSAKHPILDLNHTSSGSVIREFRVYQNVRAFFFIPQENLPFCCGNLSSIFPSLEPQS
ncbi:hypothetical protein, partial [Sutterella wadsworthensis]|uniref:hypothetical protein n=1 Tax=Sutterella wadsworthensis TaxID=40545 RepID=UPI0019D05EC1